MPNCIVWQEPGGSLRITIPADPAADLNAVAAQALAIDPSLANCTRLADVDVATLPARTYREFWQHNGSAVTVDAVAAQQTLLTRFRAKAAALIDQVQDTQAAKDRALLLVMMDELNLLRAWVTSFKAAVAASTNLANLQTRVAALNSLPQRTASQIRPAVQGKMTAGDADS